MNDSPLELISESLTAGDCLLLVLSRRRRSAPERARKVSVRPVVIRQAPLYQCTFDLGNKATHENLEPRAAAKRVVRLLAESFEDGALYTAGADYSIRTRTDGSFSCTSGPPSKAP